MICLKANFSKILSMQNWEIPMDLQLVNTLVWYIRQDSSPTLHARSFIEHQRQSFTHKSHINKVLLNVKRKRK